MMDDNHSSLVLGAAQFGLNYGINNKNGQVSTEAVVEILKLAWNNGIREIDTAQDYGNSEQVLGTCLEKFTKNFVVHSKFTLKDKSIQESINESLANLKISQLGYFYFHRFSDYLEVRGSLDKNTNLQHCAGLAVSVYDVNEIKLAINDIHIKAIQLPLNLFDTSQEKMELIKIAQDKGKKIYIRSVFLQGLFFMSPDKLPSKLQNFSGPLDKLNKICQKSALDMKSLALGYVKSIVGVEGILIGVDTKEQLQENLEAFKIQLSPAIIKEIHGIEINDQKLLLPKNWN